MKIVIGIDQSYKRTGLTISIDGKVRKSMSFTYKGCKINTEKRNYMKRKVYQVLKKVSAMDKPEGCEIIIIVERIRIASHGFLSMDYLISTGALIASIVDTAYEFNIPVYSVDTRSWKAQIVGNSKARVKEAIITRGKNKGKTRKVLDTKSETLEFCKNKLKIDCGDNDDKADSIAISLYGFIPKSKQKLKLEG